MACVDTARLPAAAANWIEVEGRPCATGCGWLRHSSTRWTPRIWFLWRMNFGHARGPWAGVLRLCLLSCGFMHAVGSGRWPLPYLVASQALVFQVDLANQHVDPEARSFLCRCCASTTVGERLLRFVHTFVPPHEAPQPAPWAPVLFHAFVVALDRHRSKMLIFAQSPEAPIVHQGRLPLLASTPPVPPLFPLESLKQANGLGLRAAQAKWA
jgi:hypothetical protein